MKLKETLNARLAALSPRERQMILAAAAVVGAALAYLALDWTLAERERLARALPRAEAELALMQRQAEELGRLGRGSAPVRAALAVQKAAAERGAAARGLALGIAQSGDALAVSGQADAAALLDWLASLHAEQGLVVRTLKLGRAGALLSVDAVLGVPPER